MLELELVDFAVLELFVLESVALLIVVLRCSAVPVPAELAPVPTPVPSKTVVGAVPFLGARVVLLPPASEARGVVLVTVVEAEELDFPRGRAARGVVLVVVTDADLEEEEVRLAEEVVATAALEEPPVRGIIPE